MQVEPLLHALRARVRSHADLGGGDAGLEDAVDLVLDALDPAVRHLALDLAQQAAGEVGAQLTDRTVEVVLVDGDPHLRVTDAVAEAEPTAAEDEEFDARITLRLPPRLKSLVEEAAETAGASVNGYLVDVLASKARRPADRPGGRVRTTLDL